MATDFCPEMLGRLPEKADRAGVASRVRLGVADCLRLPFSDDRFDLVAVAFGIRNVIDPEAGLREMARVLAPGGRMVVLEFGYPRRRLVRLGYAAHRRVIPWIGRLFLGRAGSAYRYLNDSVARFAREVDLTAILTGLGLERVERRELSLGVVQLVVGHRPLREPRA